MSNLKSTENPGSEISATHSMVIPNLNPRQESNHTWVPNTSSEYFQSLPHPFTPSYNLPYTHVTPRTILPHFPMSRNIYPIPTPSDNLPSPIHQLNEEPKPTKTHVNIHFITYLILNICTSSHYLDPSEMHVLQSRYFSYHIITYIPKQNIPYCSQIHPWLPCVLPLPCLPYLSYLNIRQDNLAVEAHMD